MPEYRRSKTGITYFFTVVTYRRKPILTSKIAREVLHAAWGKTQERFPFVTNAICLLLDHIHCLWTLPENDLNYSIRWKEIKRIFTKEYQNQIGVKFSKGNVNSSREEAAIWQRRFWEHTIRDDKDFNNHLDYIHYNPVKHGLVSQVSDWEWSSFHRYVQMGIYDKTWNLKEEKDISFGE